MYLLSIIIPIYNAEKTIKRAIDSVITQSIGFEHIELILVDDNSKDSSKDIIQDYNKKYNNIKAIFLNENHGSPSIPRNYGINYSTTDYIMFMDNDDEYCDDFCETLYNSIINENADVVSCNFYNMDEIHTSKIKFNYNDSTFTNLNNVIIDSSETLIIYDNVFIWNKIFKKEIIKKHDIKFYNRLGEDFIFTMEYLLNSEKRIYLKDYYGYKRHIQKNSLSVQNNSVEKVQNQIDLAILIDSIIKKNINPNYYYLKNNILKMPIKWIIGEILSLNNKEKMLKCLKLLYSFEIEISFNEKLDNFFINFINKLLLKKQFKLIILILNLVNTIKNYKIIRKFYRILLSSNQ